MTQTDRDALALASLLLEYPDEDLLAILPELFREIACLENKKAAAALSTFAKRLQEIGKNESCREYVVTFDHDPAASLHMSWHRYGNDRSQGKAMAALNGLYRAAGFEPVKGTLPDYLPRMLEFLSVCDEWAMESLLDGFGPEIARLVSHLEEQNSAHAPMLKAVLAPLREKWPRHFKQRTGPDPTARMMARPEPEEVPIELLRREKGNAGDKHP